METESTVKVAFEDILAFLQTEEGKRSIQEFADEWEREYLCDNLWCEKIHNLSFEQRKSLVDKIKAKYNSDAYKDRWYNHPKGPREPQEGLYWLAYEYAMRYGKDYDDGYIDFVSECRLVDDYFVVSRFDGQGSFIRIQTIEENKKEVERLESLNNGL